MKRLMNISTVKNFNRTLIIDAKYLTLIRCAEQLLVLGLNIYLLLF